MPSPVIDIGGLVYQKLDGIKAELDGIKATVDRLAPLLRKIVTKENSIMATEADLEAALVVVKTNLDEHFAAEDSTLKALGDNLAEAAQGVAAIQGLLTQHAADIPQVVLDAIAAEAKTIATATAAQQTALGQVQAGTDAMKAAVDSVPVS